MATTQENFPLETNPHHIPESDELRRAREASEQKPENPGETPETQSADSAVQPEAAPTTESTQEVAPSNEQAKENLNKLLGDQGTTGEFLKKVQLEDPVQKLKEDPEATVDSWKAKVSPADAVREFYDQDQE